MARSGGLNQLSPLASSSRWGCSFPSSQRPEGLHALRCDTRPARCGPPCPGQLGPRLCSIPRPGSLTQFPLPLWQEALAVWPPLCRVPLPEPSISIAAKGRGVDLPGGPAAESLPATAGDPGSIAGPGTKTPHAAEQPSPCAATTALASR